MASTKIRLDQLLVTRGLAESRSKAQALIMAGEVRVAGQVQTRPAIPVAPDTEVEVEAALPYVSRGGYKLAHALDTFRLDPTGLVALDAGASTGGFTDVLLQRGARRVYAVDVGYGILHWKIRQDPRVVVMERTNIRYLTGLPTGEDGGRRTEDAGQVEDEGRAEDVGRRTEDGGQAEDGARSTEHGGHVQDDEGIGIDSTVGSSSSVLRPASPVLADCAVVDVSFISLELVLPAIGGLLVPGGWIIALIKPQFEAGAEQVGKGGVVRDPTIHRGVLRRALTFAASIGLPPRGLTRSPITGPAGNIEFLVWLEAGGTLDIERAIREVT